MSFITNFIPLPTPVVAVGLLSWFICIPILVLAIFNFGVLSIWFNLMTASLTLAFYITVATIASRRRRSTVASHQVSPATSTAMTAAQPSLQVTIPKASQPEAPSVAYSTTSVSALVLLVIFHGVGFGNIVQLTLTGASSLLPAERQKGVTHRWDIKIQIAQCTLIGLQVLLIFALMVICAIGRNKIVSADQDKEDELYYDMGTPVSRTASSVAWAEKKELELA